MEISCTYIFSPSRFRGFYRDNGVVSGEYLEFVPYIVCSDAPQRDFEWQYKVENKYIFCILSHLSVVNCSILYHTT